MTTKKLSTYRLSQETLATIEDIRNKLNVSNNTEVVRTAIRLLDEVATNQINGGSTIIRCEGKDKEIVVL